MANTAPTMTSDERKQAAEYRRLIAEMKSGTLDKMYAGMMATSFTKFLAKASLTIQYNTKAFFSKFGGALNTYFRQVFGDIIDTFKPLIDMFAASIQLIWNVFKPLAKFAVTLVIAVPKKIIDLVWKGVTFLYEKSFNLLKKVGRAIFIKPAKSVLKFIGEMLISVWSFITTPIKMAASIMFGIVKSVARSIVVNTINFIAWGIGKIISAPGAIVGWFIRKITPSWFGSIAAPIVSTLITGAIFTLLTKGAFSFGKGIFDTVSKAIGGFFDSAVSTVKGYFDTAWSWFEKNFPEAATYIKDVIKWVKVQTANVYDMITGVIEGMIPFTQSLLSSFGLVFTTLAAQLPKYVVDGLKAATKTAPDQKQLDYEKEKEKTLRQKMKDEIKASQAFREKAAEHDPKGIRYKQFMAQSALADERAFNVANEWRQQKTVVDNMEKDVKEAEKLKNASKTIMEDLTNAIKTNLPVTVRALSGDVGVIPSGTETAGTGSHMQYDSLGVGTGSVKEAYLTELKNSDKYIKFVNGKVSRGIDDAIRADPTAGMQLLRMAQKFQTMGYGKLIINASARTAKQQIALGGKGLGLSGHEQGISFDTNTNQLDILEKKGLLKEFGFDRNLVRLKGLEHETWHFTYTPGAGDKKNNAITQNTDAVMANTEEREKANKKEGPLDTIMASLGGAFNTLISGAGNLTADDLLSLGGGSNVPNALATLTAERQETAITRAQNFAHTMGSASTQYINFIIGNNASPKMFKTNPALFAMNVDTKNSTS